MISSSLYLVPVFGLALSVNSQCVTSGYVPCLAPGSNIAVAPAPITPYSGGSSTGGSFGSGFWSSINGVAEDPIQVRRSLDSTSPPLADAEIEKPQNSLCCRPAPVECLTADGVPFCYNPATTRLFFSDGSYAFLSNDTYYGSDGTFINYATGVYIYPNGTEVDFTPDGSAASSTIVDNSSPSTSVEGGSEPSTSSVASLKATPITTTTKSSSNVAVTTPTTSSSQSSSSSSSSAKSNDAVAPVQPTFLFAALGLVAVLF